MNWTKYKEFWILGFVLVGMIGFVIWMNQDPSMDTKATVDLISPKPITVLENN